MAKSYILDRTQSVKLKDVSSSERRVVWRTSGIRTWPFDVCVIFRTIRGCDIMSHDLRCMMYADDTQLYVFVNRIKDRSAMVSKLETCVMDIFAVQRSLIELLLHPFEFDSGSFS